MNQPNINQYLLLLQSNRLKFASCLLLKLRRLVTLKFSHLIWIGRWILIYGNLDLGFWVWLWLIFYVDNELLSLEVPNLSLSLSCDEGHLLPHRWKPILCCWKIDPIAWRKFTFLRKQCQQCSPKNLSKWSHQLMDAYL